MAVNITNAKDLIHKLLSYNPKVILNVAEAFNIKGRSNIPRVRLILNLQEILLIISEISEDNLN